MAWCCILPAYSPVQIPFANLISLLVLTYTAYAPPLNVASLVNVEAPDTLTWSKCVWPSTSKSPLISTVTAVVTPVTFKDVAKMIIFFMMNEDRVYNKPWHKGAKMIIEYFKEVF